MPKVAFTPNNVRTIIDSVAKGNYLSTACESAGISYRTVAKWMSEGKNDEDSKYHDFYISVTQAKALFEEQSVETIVNTQSPKYLLEILGRKDPSKWSATSRVNLMVAEQIEGFMHFIVEGLKDSPEALELFLSLASKYEQDNNTEDTN